MALKPRNMKDFCAGLMFIGIGGFFGLGALRYTMGSASRMGPAYFPSILGWLTVIIGVIVAGRSFFEEGDTPAPVAWRAMICIIGSVCLFAALINTAGLVTAICVQVIVAAYGGHEFNWKEAAISAAILSLVSYIAFDRLLGLPFKVFPWSY